MRINEDQLKEFIEDSGLVTKLDIKEAEKVSEEREISIGRVLVENDKITEEELNRIKAYVLGIPFIDLTNKKIDFEVLSMIPEPIARNHNIIAFKKTERELEVAMIDTEDLGAINFIKKKVGLKILPRLTNNESIKGALVQYQKSLKAEFGDIIQKQSKSLKAISELDVEDASEETLKKIAEDLPVVRIVDTLLKHAIIQDASDIHIEPMEDKLLIRYRIDGILRDAMILPKNASASITARIKVLARLKLDEKRLPQDGRFKIDLDDQRVSFRVSMLPMYFGEKTVMRLLKESASGFTLETLGFHGAGLERIHSALRQKTGMILTTGPTGSGKTTTLYTLLDILNIPEVNISTIEDPIEYQMPRINQTQVKPEIEFTFSSGLRALVRQDPDVIMVGEIRDNETASLATNASLTGHLVLSTLHTNSSAGAIPRLVDMKIDPFLLVSTVKVIIGQRLVRKLCEGKKKYFLSKSELEKLSEVVDLDRMLKFLKEEKVIDEKTTWAKVPFYKPKETLECPSGYRGRLGIHEILEVSSGIKELMMRNSTADEVEKQAVKEGMMTMIEDGIFKAVQGVTTIEEVLRVISE
ncbi:GspE/PulE family protein [Patescibacteria group bacterium]